MMELEYQIVRSPKRKKLTITVERDRAVIVHAREETSEEEVRRVVDAKRQWILTKLRHPQKYQDRLHPPGKEVVNGESAPYLGRDYRIEVTETASGEVEFSDSFSSCRPRIRPSGGRCCEIGISRGQKKRFSPAWSSTPASLVSSSRRPGSSTIAIAGVPAPSNDNVNFNWRLIKAPMFVIDYVIVHELAHLIEPNHTSRFWSIVRAKTPTMEKAKAWLRAWADP